MNGARSKLSWDGHLGVSVPGAIETLRRYVVAQIEVLDANAGAQARVRRLRKLVDGGQIGLMLQLLVLAEDSYYQWQRLRLERVRVVEPEHLAGVIARANEQLAADLRRDSEMVELLQARLAAYAAPRPLERLHPLAARDLRATMTSLRPTSRHSLPLAAYRSRAGQSRSDQPSVTRSTSSGIAQLLLDSTQSRRRRSWRRRLAARRLM